MRSSRIAPRKSLLGRANSNKSIRFNSSKREFPPSYLKWLELMARLESQEAERTKFKRRKVNTDRSLDTQLQLCEVDLLYELAGDNVYKIPKDALRAIASSLWQYHRGSNFTHWSSRLPRSNEPHSDPQILHLKGFAVAYIRQANSEIEKKRRRKFVAQKFGKDRRREKDWELSAAKGKLDVPDYSRLAAKGLPFLIDDSLIEQAGARFQVLTEELSKKRRDKR